MAPEDEDLDLADLEAAAAQRPPVEGPDHDPTVEPQDADDHLGDADEVDRADPGPQPPIAGVGQAIVDGLGHGTGDAQNRETT